MSLLIAIAGRRRGRWRLGGLVALSLIGACWYAGSASAATYPVTVGSPGSAEFTPQVLNIHTGDTVTWSVASTDVGQAVYFGNAGTCTPDGTFGEPIQPGQQLTRVFTVPGTYTYFDPAGCQSIGGTGLFPWEGEVVVTGASAAKTAALTATVSVASQFKSVTVSTASETFGNCSGGSSSGATLGFPNGSCSTPSFSVTNNGSVPESVDVQATNATPADGGTAWTLIGSGSTPGQDQYQLRNNGGYLSASPVPDPAAGTLQPNLATSENLSLTGPSASSDPSGSFSTAVTWTAI